MKVGVLCEFSGTVRDAFLRHGHDAISCDLLPTEAPGPHIQGDCLAQDWTGFDLLICHPPCTYLSVSGLHWNKRVPGRAEKTEEALAFVRALLALPVERIALENPVSCISTRIRKPDQIIQPWMFGHPESKATCLWLKGLPKLQPTNVLPLPASGRWSNQTPGGQNKLGPSPDRWKIRSATYAGIAEAFADQWGDGWRRVVFAADCDGDDCPQCLIDYAECACPGPTQDGVEYREDKSGLWGRIQTTTPADAGEGVRSE